MIKPLTLGDKQFPVNIIQGPLAGVSCAPFRLLTWRYSRPAFSCTEMISCKTLIHQPSLIQRRYIKKDPAEGPVCFQLAGDDPEELAEATKRATDYGADLIDLNCGCPVKKIRNKGAGSSLLTNSVKLYQLIRAMKQNTHLPVSVKIRVEGGGEVFNENIAQAIEEAGADFLIVHGRHWTEHYETPCRYDQIKYFVERLKIPVIGNGDVACLVSLQMMLQTGCAGVMVGRASVGQPWLIGQLIAKLNQQDFLVPTIPERGLIFMEHVELLAELLSNEMLAILQTRKMAKYYARGLLTKHDFLKQINTCMSFNDLKKICQQHFNNGKNP